MPIESPQHRPPQDMNCPMLQIVTGCAHGQCLFCDIFNGVPFTASPMEEVLSDIDAIASKATALTRRIYLTGGNPFALPTSKLTNIFNEIESRIPSVNSYGGFCRIMDIARKTDGDLSTLASRGVNDITIGAESGYDDALDFMKKGHHADDIIAQGKRLHDAGIDFTFFYLAGMAGAGKSEENALRSAEVFSAAGPSRILVVSMTPTQTWPLARAIEEGLWIPPSEEEMAQEIRTFVENLNCTCALNCSHDTDIIKFEGMIPSDQSKMVTLLDNLIPKMNENASRHLREMLHKATF